MVGPLGPAAIGGLGWQLDFVCDTGGGLGRLLNMDTFVSAALGAHDPKMAHTYLVPGLWLALLLSVPLPSHFDRHGLSCFAQPLKSWRSATVPQNQLCLYPIFLISVAFQRYWQARQQ